MNPLTQQKNLQKIIRLEAERGTTESASWHSQFKHSAYIFAGGLAYDLTEGDILAVFAEYGEIVDLNLPKNVEDPKKNRGFAFLAYEDQRSTVLAVDNFGGASVAGRRISVEHVGDYKKKRKEMTGEESSDESGGEEADVRATAAAAGSPGRKAPGAEATGRAALLPLDHPLFLHGATAGPAPVAQHKVPFMHTHPADCPPCLSQVQKEKKARKEKKDRKEKRKRGGSSSDDEGTAAAAPRRASGVRAAPQQAGGAKYGPAKLPERSGAAASRGIRDGGRGGDPGDVVRGGHAEGSRGGWEGYGRAGSGSGYERNHEREGGERREHSRGDDGDRHWSGEGSRGGGAARPSGVERGRGEGEDRHRTRGRVQEGDGHRRGEGGWGGGHEQRGDDVDGPKYSQRGESYGDDHRARDGGGRFGGSEEGRHVRGERERRPLQ